jgi:enoyl-CoA hydratase
VTQGHRRGVTSPFVRLERRGDLAWCVIDRPERRNAFTPEMYMAIGTAVDRAEDDGDAGALVLIGTADSFVAGGDIGESEAFANRPLSEVLPFDHIRRCTIPVVAAINGLCQASGLVMAMLADVSVASDRATFRAPEVSVGFFDSWLAALLPQHVGVGRAKDIVFSGRAIDANTALQMGLVTRVVPHDELADEAVRAARQLIRGGHDARHRWKAEFESRYRAIDARDVDAAGLAPEAIEGLAAARERRTPSWIRTDERHAATIQR